MVRRALTGFRELWIVNPFTLMEKDILKDTIFTLVNCRSMEV